MKNKSDDDIVDHSVDAADVAEEVAGEASGGESDSGSGSMSDEGSTDAELDEEEDVDDTVWDAIQDHVPRGDATKRIALMGCDWDHASATDVLVLVRRHLNGSDAKKAGSALHGAVVSKVTIFPSDFGLEQMALENKEGPISLFKETKKISAMAGSTDQEEEEKRQNEALRKYQMQRTKYYYAVADCDSLTVASWLYDQLDGLEVSGITPNLLDVRFIPDDLVFPHKPHSEAVDIPKRYSGPVEVRNVIGQSKVHCSWDEAPPKRKKDLMNKRFTEAEAQEMDLKDYLASSSSAEDEAELEEQRKALRETLGLGGGSDEDGIASGDGSEKEEVFGDMEATFNLEAEELGEKLAERSKEEKVHTLKSEAATPWQQYLEKRKHKRKEKRTAQHEARVAQKKGEPNDEPVTEMPDVASQAELELLVDDKAKDLDRGFNARGKLRTAAQRAEKKAASGAQLESGFSFNAEDPRIAAVFSGAEFEIDPTHPEYRAGTGMKQILKRKRDRKQAPRQQPITDAQVKDEAQTAVRHDSKVQQNSALRLFASKRQQDTVDSSTRESGEDAGRRAGTVRKKRKSGAKMSAL